MAGSLSILFPLLSWEQRSNLSRMFAAAADRQTSCPGTSTTDARVILQRLAAMFDPIEAVLRGPQRCRDEIAALLSDADCDALLRTHRVVSGLLRCKSRSSTDAPEVDGIVLECIGALLRDRVAATVG